MTKYKLTYLFLLRIAFGWLFLYSGITKILNPNWTALEYLKSAKTMTFLYQWFSTPGNIELINILNSWGQLLIGLSLIFGVLVRLSSLFGILMMFLYYIPELSFPYVGKNAFLVDQHIIYILIFTVLFEFDKDMKKFNLALLLSRYVRSLFSPSQKSPKGRK